jgi:hypothetical protein
MSDPTYVPGAPAMGQLRGAFYGACYDDGRPAEIAKQKDEDHEANHGRGLGGGSCPGCTRGLSIVLEGPDQSSGSAGTIGRNDPDFRVSLADFTSTTTI